MDAGIEVRLWYVGLPNVELHIARVHARLKRGGHDIREERIRQILVLLFNPKTSRLDTAASVFIESLRFLCHSSSSVACQASSTK